MNLNQNNDSPTIRFTPSKDDSFTSGEGNLGTRPTGDPKSAKNFQKILKKDKREGDAHKLSISEEEEELAMANEGIQSPVQKKPPSSLFELSSTLHHQAPAKIKKVDNVPIAQSAQTQDKAPDVAEEGVANKIVDEHVESPSSMYAKIAARDPKTHAEILTETSPKDTKKENFSLPFAASEQPDISYVNPLALVTQQTQNINLKTEKAIFPASSIQDIINQLVHKVVEIKDQGKTETIITLKHPPLLAGANLVVTAFDSAKGEFNLSFENLTQSAKNMLDLRMNQDSLRLALEQRGYAVHIITTTTLTESRPIIETTPEQDRQAADEQEKEENQKRQQNQR